jgi:hypothetical protein
LSVAKPYPVRLPWRAQVSLPAAAAQHYRQPAWQAACSLSFHFPASSGPQSILIVALIFSAGTLESHTSNQQLARSSQQQVVRLAADEVIAGAAAADDSQHFPANSRHVHLHMHMHAAPVLPAPVCSMNVAIAGSIPQQQQHTLQDSMQQPWVPVSSGSHQDLKVKTYAHQDANKQSQKQQQSSQQQQQQATGAEAAASILRPRQQRSRVRRLLRAMVVTGAATAVALAGAGIAAAALAPRMEHLEVRYQQVRAATADAGA